MLFQEVLEIEDCCNGDSYIRRQAVRAVVLKDNKLLLIHTNKGDYKFPGGGMEQEESHQETIIREVEEETGYRVDKVDELIGITIEKKPDKYDRTKIFEMTSYYYLCTVGSGQMEQKLDQYEAEQEFKPVWISPRNALSKNIELIKHRKSGLNPWICREVFVMQKLTEGM